MADLRERLEELSPEKRELLELLLAEQAGDAPRAPEGLAPRDWAAGEEAPLSLAQRRLWLIDRIDPHSAAYNMPSAFELTGDPRSAALDATLREIVRRHEVLRTYFPEVEGEPVQRVAALESFRPGRVELTRLRPEDRERETIRSTRQDAGRPFDLTTGPVFRAHWIRSTPDRSRVLLNVHHIASDGWSVGVLAREMVEIYRAFSRGEPSRLPELPVQYRDYAAWQRERHGQRSPDREVEWWRRQLDGAPALLQLPTDRPRRADRSREAGHLRFSIPADLADAPDGLASHGPTTRLPVLLAAFAALLARYADQRDVVVGIPSAGRDEVELEGLIGFFVNTLPVRVRLRDDPSFSALVERVREAVLEVQAHQDIPFETLVERLVPDRHLAHTPIFQVMLSMETVSGGEAPELPGVALEPVTTTLETAKFDLTLTLRDEGERLDGALVYDRSLFDAGTLERLTSHFRRLLEAAAASPDRPLSEQSLLTESERRQVLEAWSGESSGYARGMTIPAQFRAVARERSGEPALVAGDRRLSYGELAARADGVAAALRRRGVGPESRVGLCLARGFDLVASILGILQAGGAYVPLDPSYPAERLRFLVEDSGVEVIVGDGDLLPDLPDEVEILSAVQGERTDDGAAPADAEPVEAFASPESLAYVMYTSGSTGRPKGVAVSHRNVLRLVREADFASLGPERTMLLLAPVSFDASTLELWGPLLNGGRLVIVESVKPSLAELGEVIREHGVDTLWLTAGLFHLAVDEAPEMLSGVSQLLAGGDVLSPVHVGRILERHPGLAVINGYGPTENTTFTTCHRMESAAAVRSPVPIGRPIADTRVRILDGRMQPVPVGLVGELYAGGDGLARGYWGRPGWTAQRFVPDPYGREGGERLYRTGDRARWLADGTLEFLGRMDAQVKIRGFRIEPGEVESALASLAAVREAAVLVVGEGGEKALAAYVVPEAEAAGEVTAEQLQGLLAARLPEHLVPGRWALLPEMPLTPNGKIDRRALREHLTVAPGDGEAEAGRGVAPRDDLEGELVALWQQVLDRPVGVTDDFFALGGHSLAAIRLLARIGERFDRELPLASLFEHGTVADQARLLREEADVTPVSPLVALSPEGEGEPFFCVHPVGGDVFSYRTLASRLARPFWGLQSVPGPRSLEAMAEGYAEEIATVHPEGPLHLGGWSMGAVVAFEMAEWLGHRVDRLVLLDPPSVAGEHALAGADEGALLRAFARDLLGIAGAGPDALEELSRRLGEGSIDEGLSVLLEALSRQGAPFEHDRRRLVRWFERFRVNARALATHTPRRRDVAVELVVAGPLHATDPTRGWGRVAGAGLRLHRVSGDHYSLLREPVVDDLAEQLDRLFTERFSMEGSPSS